MTKSGTKCEKSDKGVTGLALGVTGLGIRCDRIGYKVRHSLVQDMTKSALPVCPCQCLVQGLT